MESLGKLRRKVAEYVELHMYDSAAFLADKLVTMSDGDENVRLPGTPMHDFGHQFASRL